MRKTGLDSFPINVVNNDNVDKLIKEYGYEGHAFLIAICQKIFQERAITSSGMSEFVQTLCFLLCIEMPR